MTIHLAIYEEIHIVHKIMMDAFYEYKDTVPPSSALEETIESIQDAWKQQQELAGIYILNQTPVGMIRFSVQKNNIYFFRLSVHPDHRGKGIAKELLHWLEDYAKKYNKKYITCKVRATIPKNIKLYESVGYQVYEEDIVYKKDGTSVKTISMKKPLFV
ncbi:GNAT family N-acetyltransferase [Ectobacillus panaciterrae]|uniref:GNAT family N-acetyltransferase n=1 Tax=Ectobacillus panaciterrae TaxID=363872 RepID=UPI0004241703|nr:GNAT family N-acetyltransferase [Ectobacillus panaciterrae]